MRVAVTGGTGYIGAHAVRALLDAGHEARLLVRRPALVEEVLVPLGVGVDDVESVAGDVTDEPAVRTLLDGCDAVVHAAAMVALDPHQAEAMRRTNVGGTALVLGTAHELGLDPIVHVSSYSALFPSPDPVIGPDSPVQLGRSAYGSSKAQAELHARGMQGAGAPVVTIYPTGVVGPAAGSRVGEVFEGWSAVVRTGWAPGLDAAVLLVDVRDLAAVIVAVLEPGRGPRRYVCGGHRLGYDEVLRALETAVGRRIRTVPIPSRAFRGLALVLEKLGRVLPVPPVLTHDAAVLLTTMQPTDDSATVADLGITFRSPLESIADAFHAHPTP